MLGALLAVVIVTAVFVLGVMGLIDDRSRKR